MSAWDEDEDDPLKVLQASPSQSPTEEITGAEIRQRIGQDSGGLSRPPIERLSSTEDADRQPQAASGNKTSKAGAIKNAMVSKLSEKLGKHCKTMDGLRVLRSLQLEPPLYKHHI